MPARGVSGCCRCRQMTGTCDESTCPCTEGLCAGLYIRPGQPPLTPVPGSTPLLWPVLQATSQTVTQAGSTGQPAELSHRLGLQDNQPNYHTGWVHRTTSRTITLAGSTEQPAKLSHWPDLHGKQLNYHTGWLYRATSQTITLAGSTEKVWGFVSETEPST